MQGRTTGPFSELALKVVVNPISDIYPALERIAPDIRAELLGDGNFLEVSTDDNAPWYTLGFGTSYKVYHADFRFVLNRIVVINVYSQIGRELVEELVKLISGNFEIQVTIQPPKRSRYISLSPI